jgi:hypothetical protein
MATRPLNDDEVLSEMNKMVQFTACFVVNVIESLVLCIRINSVGRVHQARGPREVSRNQSKGGRRVLN